jgi:anaerobic magnesium-protoporphyrin IX monomethyl ester cyclase
MGNELDILLINPPYERFKGLSFCGLPSGILGLATYINQCGFKAMVYDVDTNLDGSVSYDNKGRVEGQDEYAKKIDDDSFYVWKEIRDTIQSLDPAFVGISLKTPTLHSGLKIAKIAKEIGKPVLIGGPHVSIVGEKILELDLIDFVFFGEGEVSVVEFLKSYPDIDKLGNIKGLGLKNGGKNVFNGYSERIMDLDSLPFPDRELLVFKERYQKAGLTSIMASRGCPFKCTYCASVPIWGRDAVFRSPEHIIEEIKYLHENYKVKEFMFFDDTFTAKKKNVIKLCKLLIDDFGKRYFSWICLSHASAIDEEVLYWLKKAGCNRIDLGVESGSDRILKLMHKGLTLKQAECAITLAKRNKFLVHTFFMIGLPYETMDDMKRTINFIKRTKPDAINLCTFTPYPGTELYNYCIDKGLLKHDDSYGIFKYIGHHSRYNYFLENVNKEDYLKILDEILELTTKISNSLTLRKIVYRIKILSLEKIKRKLKLELNRFIAKYQSN